MTVVPTGNRLLVALGVGAALGGAAAAALAASGPAASGARAASARATAYARDDGHGPRGLVRVSGSGSRHGNGTSASASTSGGHGRAAASATGRSVSIFGGLVTAARVSVSVSASGGATSRSGVVKRLTVNGRRRGTVRSRAVYDLGGRGKLVALDGSGNQLLGLRATLTRDFGKWRKGTTVRVAYAAASASDAVAPPPPKRHARKPQARKHKPAPKTKPRKPSRSKRTPKAKRRKAPRTRTLATSSGFVFPVYGKHSFTDDWGAPRQDTGRHEGNDIFAAAGTPVVAVCKGKLHRVGTKPVPGNRLWVVCDKGHDAFFYGHLSAFASDAHSGAAVTAGQVVGFVGSTGDAEQTPPHVHFEVHPGGGDAVDPYPFLRAWEHHRDVPAAAWVKRNGAGAGQEPGTLVVVRDFLDR
jgi:murein DD-endopeptidase MepM/ murein hydrolase activator NlpD